MKKASHAFPASPTRKKAVLAKIVSDLDVDDRNELLEVISTVPKRQSMNSEMIQAIHDFYERDDVSRASPKMRDVKKSISAETGLEVLLPMGHMILTVKEAYALFAEERKTNEKGYYNYYR